MEFFKTQGDNAWGLSLSVSDTIDHQTIRECYDDFELVFDNEKEFDPLEYVKL